MENRNTDTNFVYTYSAKEQDEIKRIRQKYEKQEEDGMSRLRKLDDKVTQKATVMSLVPGIIGALVLGMGMSLIMTDFGAILGMTEIVKVAVGIVVGILGMVLVALAYPTYRKVLKEERDKIAPEILKLTEELMR